MAERLMTIPQAAKELGISPSFVWRRVVSGEWPSYRFGRSRRMTMSDVNAILAAARQTGTFLSADDTQGTEEEPRSERAGS